MGTVLTALSLSGLGAADLERHVPEQPDDQPDQTDEVAKLIAQLSDDSFPVREEASRSLWKLGQKALPYLRQAAAGNDPEAADRARELVLYISAGVLFDSPQEVKELVMKFSRSVDEGKIAIVQKLKNLGQWKQILHLARLEKNPALRSRMNEIVRQVVVRAVIDSVAEGNPELASEILGMLGDDIRSMQMRAWFECHRGKLQHELAKAADMTGKKAALWRMSLHRASANIPAAIAEAEKAGEVVLADALRALDGDALPWLQREGVAGDLDEIYALGCLIHEHRLQGKDKEAASAARDLAALAARDDSIYRVITCLAANGFRDQAIELLAVHDIDAAFEYFNDTELPQRALAVIGIPVSTKAPYTEWVKKTTDRALRQSYQLLYHRIMMLAVFLAERGERQHVISVLSPMMSALMEEGADEWFDQVRIMAGLGLGIEAVHFAKQWGDEEREVELAVECLTSEVSNKSLEHIWECLKERNPGDFAKALDELALLAGLLTDPDNMTDKLHQALIDEVAPKGAGAVQARMSALFEFSLSRNDFAGASRMADNLAGDNGWLPSKQSLDENLYRWEMIEPVLAGKAKDIARNYSVSIRWYIALRKLGRERQAAEVYQRALLLSMGNTGMLSDWGFQLYQAGYEQQAGELWMLAAATAEPGQHGYDLAIEYLANFGQPLYRAGQWQQAAAISEMFCRLRMRGRHRQMSLQNILRAAFYSQFCQGMHLLQTGKRQAGIKRLDAARQLVPGDGLLADDFFPALRKQNPGAVYDRWFEESYRHVQAACKLYPGSHNSHNTAAWLASRAVRELDAGLTHAEKALAIRPSEGAYLDTMAEIWFARGNREKALEWSRKAIAGSISSARGKPRSKDYVLSNFKQLNKQLDHFKNDPLPAKAR